MMSIRYISVRTDLPRERVERYLYSHTTILECVEVRSNDHNQVTRNSFILRTLAETGSHADHLAQYQAARLCSGLMSATVHDNYWDARITL